MKKVKTRKKSGKNFGRTIIILLVLILPILVSKIQIIGDQKSNYDILILVNKNNKLPDEYSIDLTTFSGCKVAQILVGDLKDMINSAKKQNILLEINTSYRTKSEQQEIFDNTVSGYIKDGNSHDVADQKTKELVALPGYSEHETGLAIDFTSSGDYNNRLKAWDWLEVNAYKYGFILRYPEGKESITGYNYEAWHYRYVGIECATIIYENDLTLEEYL